MPFETWMPIPRARAYSVSDAGRVRGPSQKILKPQSKSGGYRYISLRIGGKTVSAKIAVVVLEAFVGDRPEGHHVAHDNGVSTDDRLDNLKYKTPKANNADKIAHGTAQRGEQANGHLLTEVQVRDIRSRRLKNVEFARLYGVSKTTITQIVKGQRWAHV